MVFLKEVKQFAFQKRFLVFPEVYLRAYRSYEMLCAIWYHLYNLKNVKNNYGRLLVLLKVSLLHGCFSRFLNCTNGTKSRKTSLNDAIFFAKVVKDV